MEPGVVNIPGLAQTNKVLGLDLQERDAERLHGPLPHINIVLQPTNNAPNNMVPALQFHGGLDQMIFRAAYGPQVGRSPPLVLLVTATHSGNPAPDFLKG